MFNKQLYASFTMQHKRLEYLFIVYLALLISGCSSFNILKGGVQVSATSSELKYQPFAYQGKVCLRGNKFDICHKLRHQIKNSYLRISAHKTNIRLHCQTVSSKDQFMCSTSVQVAGPLGISIKSLDSSLREWGPIRCDWLKRDGSLGTCSEANQYLAQIRENKTKQLEIERKAKIANEAQIIKEKKQLQKKCEKDSIALRNNLTEGNLTAQGLVVEVKDKVTLIQRVNDTKWYDKSSILAPSCL